MNASPEPKASQSSITARITQPRLRVAVRILWFVVAVASVATFARSFPLLHRYVYNPSDAAWSAALAQLGLSPDFYFVCTAVLSSVTFLIFAAVGVILFWRRPDDGMALFVSIFLIAFGGVHASPGIIAPSYGQLDADLVANLFWILYLVASLLAYPLFIFLLGLFPDGRFVPRWMRIIAVFGFIFSVGWSLFPREFDTPKGLLAVIVPLATVIIGPPSLYAQVYRYRRVSIPSQRQQTKWFVLGIAFYLTLVTVQIILSALLPFFQQPGPATEMFNTFFALLSVCIPLSIGVAVLRYRLWDVDFVINRSLVYGGLTVVLGAIFAGGFFAVRAALEAILGGEQAIIAAVIATAVVFTLFAPTRRRLRRFVDRRFYGIEIKYQTPPGLGRQIVDGELAKICLGDYTGLEPIGSGGMAEIYRAQHPTLNRTVAVKILPQRLAQEGEFRRRFEREAQVVTRLKHPNIVQMHDFGEAEGMAYMVMEYIEGQDLADLIRGAGRLPLEQVRAILGDIAAALDYAHQQGLVHRDIKPSNVMLDPVMAGGGGRAYRAVLMDFGIAKIVGGMTALTKTGMVGTLDYIAPEQIQAASEVDGRADVYSLGVMVYQMVTGELPFPHNNPGALLMAHLMQPPPDPRQSVPDLPVEAAEGIVQAMAKKPDGRFATAGALATALG